MDAHKIKLALSDRVEDLCRYLLPQGTRKSNYWHVGSVAGEPGDSLRVCLNGVKRGVWIEGASGKGGSCLDLWMETKGVVFKEALSQARSWLGISEPVHHHPRKEYVKPSHTAFDPLEKIGSKALSYLTQERKIPASIIQDFGVGRKNGKAIAYPYYEPDGELSFVKFIDIALNANGKKIVSVTAGAKPVLFGMNTKLVRESRGSLGICEGENDAMSWQAECLPFCSVPFGAKAERDTGGSPNDEWIDNCWDFLAGFDAIYLSMDMDEEGQKAARAIAKRLGIDRCKFITLPKKDANECLKAGIKLRKYFDEAKTIEPDDVVCASEMSDDAWNEISKGPEDAIGTLLFGWEEFAFRIRPREGTIWSGYNSHGKTTLLRQLVAWLAANGEPCFVGSYEDSPARFIAKMTRQAAGRMLGADDRAEYDHIKDTLMQNVIMHKIDGIADWRKFFEHAEYAVRRYGIKHAILDNISSTNLDLDEKKDFDVFTRESQSFWKRTGAHLHVVAHPRKPGEDGMRKVPTSDTIKGSGTFTDLFWNVLVVHRKESDASSIHCFKQRETGEKPHKDLEFNVSSGRFRIKGHPDDTTPYITYNKSQSTDLPE